MEDVYAGRRMSSIVCRSRGRSSRLAGDQQTLDHCPSKGRESLNLSRHVFIAIVNVDNRIQLELDSIVSASVSNAEEPDHIPSVVAPSNLLVRLGVKRIA